MKFKYMTLVLLSMMFCSSNPYEEDLSFNGDVLFREISNFEDTDRDLDNQCSALEEEREYHENDNLPLAFFVEYEYYKYRYVRWMLPLEEGSFFWGALVWAEQGIQGGAGVWELCKIQDCT